MAIDVTRLWVFRFPDTVVLRERPAYGRAQCLVFRGDRGNGISALILYVFVPRWHLEEDQDQGGKMETTWRGTMENKKSHKKSFRIYLSIVAVLLLLQVVAWSSRSPPQRCLLIIFFPIWVNTYGRITRVVSLFRGRMDDCGRDSGGACCGCAGMQFADSGVQTFGKVLPGSEGIFWFFCMDVACRICHYDAGLYHDLSWVYIFGEIFR